MQGILQNGVYLLFWEKYQKQCRSLHFTGRRYRSTEKLFHLTKPTISKWWGSGQNPRSLKSRHIPTTTLQERRQLKTTYGFYSEFSSSLFEECFFKTCWFLIFWDTFLLCYMIALYLKMRNVKNPFLVLLYFIFISIKEDNKIVFWTTVEERVCVWYKWNKSW